MFFIPLNLLQKGGRVTSRGRVTLPSFRVKRSKEENKNFFYHKPRKTLKTSYYFQPDEDKSISPVGTECNTVTHMVQRYLEDKLVGKKLHCLDRPELSVFLLKLVSPKYFVKIHVALNRIGIVQLSGLNPVAMASGRLKLNFADRRLFY